MFKGGMIIMATISNYNKHLTLTERIKIEKGLNEGTSFRKISNDINKGTNTISREVENRRYKEKGNYFNGIPKKCEKIEKAPFVCNGCPNAKKCRCNKYYYSAEIAQKDYETILVESRVGIDKTTQEFKELDKVVKNDINNGHSFALIIHNHPELEVCERTLYNYQEQGYLSTSNLDLPRKVRYKKRKKKTNNSDKNSLIEQNYLKGRKYNDFLIYLKENNTSYYTEMDTVEGIIGKGQSCLLTLYIKEAEFLFIFKISEQTISCVNNKIKEIKFKIGNEMFHKIFIIILTDNGSEFKRPAEIENNGPDVLDSKVFYCEPQRSDQKSQIELSHEYIRRYIPKGISMNNYTDKNIHDMMCHINSTPRKSLDWKAPYEVFVEMFGSEVLDKLNIYKVNSKDIILKNKLFN
jgi:transposase, IS30 family